MLINEVIGRCDELIANEYTKEEKYHWCDVVGAELSAVMKEFKRAELERCADGLFLLPQDCSVERIEKILCGCRELSKQDMRLYGAHPIRRGRRQLLGFRDCPDRIAVIYRAAYEPIRRYKVCDANISINGDVITAPADIPVLGGDTITLTAGKSEYLVHVISRESRMDADVMQIMLECGEPTGLSGEMTADMERIITDGTVCEPPFDEMYIEYICAQIAFYQRKFDVYQQFISRYNSRFTEYVNFLKEYECENDRSQIINWWRL